MESVKSFWVINKTYNDVREFHFSSSVMSFVVYFKNEDVAFVLDNTCDAISPNNMLIIEPKPEDIGIKNPKTKWDSILKNKFKINPINIRPKENTKYKKLDISYASLDLYASFSSLQTDEIFDMILQNREVMALENAYEREAENLLTYNKSTQTIEKAVKSLDSLKKKILNISKKLSKQEELEFKDIEKADDTLKAELVKKLYENTEKLKRAERRIKRAKKRADNSFDDLSLKRVQIQEIKKSMEARTNFDKSLSVQQNIISNNENEKDSFSYSSVVDEKILKKQDDILEKTDVLTTENNNANNENKERLQISKEEIKEYTMPKETEQKSKVTQEFKPPVADSAKKEDSSNIRFAKKTDLLNDKYKKVWMYAASVIFSLIVVFGLFFMLSSDDTSSYMDEDMYNTNYIEQSYSFNEPQPTPFEEVEQAPVFIEEPIVQEPIVVEEPIIEEPKKEVVVAPKPTPKKVAPVKPVAKKVKPAPKKVAPKPVVKVQAPVVEEKPQEVAVNVKEEFYEEDEYFEEVEEKPYISALDEIREIYLENVIDNDAYINVINAVKSEFFLLETKDLIVKLEEMNNIWNDFRNITYNTYYDGNHTLKMDIDYDAYADDEYLLRLYSDAYFDLYNYIINEFVMTYEYANGTAIDLYDEIEAEMQILGRPNSKLMLLAKIFNAMRVEGGPADVLSEIAIRDEEETVLIDDMKIEATLVPLSATTEVVYRENLSSEDGVDIISEEATLVENDFTESYQESKELFVFPEELKEEDLETVILDDTIVYEETVDVEEVDVYEDPISYEDEYTEDEEYNMSMEVVIEDDGSSDGGDEYYDEYTDTDNINYNGNVL